MSTEVINVAEIFGENVFNDSHAGASAKESL